jgi:hypothetical protein
MNAELRDEFLERLMDQIRTVMIGDKRYHLPFVGLIPFDAEQNSGLRREIEEAGEILVPIIANKGKSKGADIWVTDGAHRVIHASDLRLDAPPIRYRKFDSDEDERDFVHRVNLERRHLAAAKLEMMRRERVERIAARRKAGESIRAIADAENVSKSQVERDLETAYCPGGGTVEPESGKVTGKDGKKKDRRYRAGLLQGAVSFGVIDQRDWEALSREFVHGRGRKPAVRPPGSMPA